MNIKKSRILSTLVIHTPTIVSQVGFFIYFSQKCNSSLKNTISIIHLLKILQKVIHSWKRFILGQKML